MARAVGRSRPAFTSPAERTQLARAVTELLAPANLAVAQLLLVSWHSSPGLAGVGWGLLTATTFCGMIPYGIVIAGVDRDGPIDTYESANSGRPRSWRPHPPLRRWLVPSWAG